MIRLCNRVAVGKCLCQAKAALMLPKSAIESRRSFMNDEHTIIHGGLNKLLATADEVCQVRSRAQAGPIS